MDYDWVMNESSSKKPDIWFIKKQGKITGPFPVKLIGSYLILGRIDLDTLVSVDKTQWIPVGRLPSLIPAELKPQAGGDELQRARLREDERRGDSRRGDQQSRRTSERNEEERRENNDRRHNEEEVSLAYQNMRKDFSASRQQEKKMARYGTIFVFLIALAVLASFFLIEPAQEIKTADCNTLLGAGIDWRSCNKNNADLVAADLTDAKLNSILFQRAVLVKARLIRADLSYANLESANLQKANLQSARLVGANLNNASLLGADLRQADLSYADLTHAILTSANLEAAIFDHAIWVDGQHCGKGSVGGCVPKPQ